MKLEVGVKALIVNRAGKYLFLRKTTPFNATGDKVTIPGGRINNDENVIDGLKREIYEETGLEIDGNPELLYVQDIYHHDNTVHTVRLTFVVNTSGEISLDKGPDNEHKNYMWLDLDEVNKDEIDRYLLPVFEKLNNRNNSS
jgi:8-oxo-dGTP diphosphatase